jgi:tetratricopeptide (TPR) repeat protein
VDAQLALERLDEAVATLELVVSTHPGDLRAVLRLGFLEFERREYASAAQWFQRALAANPEQHEVNYFLGVTERRLRRADESIAVFERIPPGHERYAEARAQIAALYEERGDYARAAAEVELARTQQPSRPLDLYLASLRAKAGDFQGALAFLEGLLVETPDDPEILYNIGVLHGEAKQVDVALGYMEKVLEKAPDHAGALNYVGYTWAEQGTNLGRAEEYVTRALAIRPEDGYIADSLGWIYYMRARPLLDAGQRQEGLAMLDRALRELLRADELTGGDPVISEHLGDAFLLQGDRERALEMYREAIELGPRPNEQPDLPAKYEKLRRELGEP